MPRRRAAGTYDVRYAVEVGAVAESPTAAAQCYYWRNIVSGGDDSNDATTAAGAAAAPAPATR